MALPEVKVKVGYDDKKLQRGLTNSERRLQMFAGAARAAASIAGVSFAAASAGIVVALKKVTAEADKIAKSAQKMGVAADELQRLQHAAGLAGVQFASLASGVGLANKNMALIASGQGLEAKRAMDALGISVRNTDGSMKSASEVMDDVADKFATFKDGANKSAIAMTIFGRSGANLVPLLNQGSAAIAAAKQELDDLGAVMSTNLLKSSERLNDNISRLGTASFGLGVAISEQLVPGLANFTGSLVEAAKKSEFLRNFVTGLGYTFRLLGKAALMAGDFISNSMEASYEDIKFLWSNLPDVIGSTFIEAVNVSVRAINALVAGTKAGINSVVSAANSVLPKFAQINPLDVDAGKIAEMTNPYAAKLEKPLVAHAERIGKIMAQRTLAAMADDPAAAPAGQPLQEAPGLAKDTTKEDALTEKLAQRLEMLRESFMTEEELTTSHLNQDVLLLQQALDAKLLTHQQHADMVEQLTERHQKTLNDIRDQGNFAMLNGLGDVLGGVGNVLKAYGEKNLKIVKGLSIAQALIAAYTGAAEALKLPFPANVAAFAGVLAKGLGAVASIKSVSTSGGGASGSGGSGGGGGGSSQAAAPEASSGGAADNRQVIVKGLSAASLIDGDTVKGIMAQMLDLQRDGYKVVLA